MLLASGLAIAVLAAPAFPASPGGVQLVPDGALALVEAQRGVEGLGEVGLARLAGWLGVSPALVESVVQGRSVVVALYPGEQREGLVILPDGEGPMALLGALAEEAPSTAGELAGNEVTRYTLRAPFARQVFLMRRGGWALIATNWDLLGRTLAAEVAPAPAGILADADLRLAREEAEDAALFVSCGVEFLRDHAGEYGVFLEGVERIHWASWHGADKGRERLRLSWSGPEPILARVFGRSAPVAEEFRLRGRAGLQALLDGSALVEEDPAGGMLLEWLTRRTGLPWKEIAPGIAGWVVVTEIGEGRLARLGLSDPGRVDRSLRTLAEGHAGFSESVIGGYLATSLEGALPLCWVLAGEVLYLADRLETLELGLEGRLDALRGEGGVRFWGAPERLAGLFGFAPFESVPSGEVEIEGTLEPYGLTLEVVSERPRLFAALLWGERPGGGEEPVLAEEPVRVARGVSDSGARDRFASLVALEQVGRVAHHRDEIVGLLADPEPAVAARAAYALGQARVPGVGGALAQALEGSADPALRTYAAYALMRAPDRVATRALVRALNDEECGVRGFAATALEKLGPGPHARPLADALVAFPEGSRESRIRILRALAEAGDPAFIPRVLVSVSTAESRDVLNALVYCLQQLTPKLGPGEVNLLAAMLDNPCIHVRRYSVERLGELGHSAAEAPLLRRLEVEGPILGPRIKVSLEAIAVSNRASTVVKGALEQAADRVLGLRERVGAFASEVREWPDWKKGLLAAFPLMLGAMLLLIRMRLRSGAERRHARRLATLVAPSGDELLEEQLGLEPFEEGVDADEALEEIEEPQDEEYEEGFEMEELPELEIEHEEGRSLGGDEGLEEQAREGVGAEQGSRGG